MTTNHDTGGPLEPLPCPWGHPAEVYEIGCPGLDPVTWGVSCSLHECPVYCAYSQDTREEAVGIWNEMMRAVRTPTSSRERELEAERDALQAAVDGERRLLGAMSTVVRRLVDNLGPLHRYPDSKVRGALADGVALLVRYDALTTKETGE